MQSTGGAYRLAGQRPKDKFQCNGALQGLFLRYTQARITQMGDKVGFTVIGNQNDPQPKFIGGVRGAIERNTMRYYLAIDAYLGALSTPAEGRFEQSLDRWFSATELYPRQLREIDRDTNIAMKRSEHQRQQTIQ